MANRVKSRTPRKSDDAGFRQERMESVRVSEVLRDERSRKIAGAFLLLTGIIVLFSQVSYLQTWRKDQDQVTAMGMSILMPNELQIANHLGAFGAYVSHLLVYRGFGVASFLLTLLLFAPGMNLLLGRRVFRLPVVFLSVAIGMLLLSLSLSFVFSDTGFPLAGALGDALRDWLGRFLGAVGTSLLLGVCWLSLFIWRFNPAFRLPSRGERAVTGETTGEGAEAPPENHEPPPPDGKPATGNRLRGEGRPTVATEAGQPAEPRGTSLEMRLVEKEEAAPAAAGGLQEAAPEPPAPEPTPNARKSGPRRPSTPSETEADGPVLEIKPVSEEGKPAPDAGHKAKAATLAPYDPVLDLRDYRYPSLDLLEQYEGERIVMDKTELEANKTQIENTLKNYDISIQRIFATVGPTVTLYEIVPAAGVRISRIKNLEDDIALSLAALGIRIIAPIPGKGTIGIEVPNVRKSLVGMRSLLASEKFQQSRFTLPIALGKKIDNELFIVDLATMPHLLMAGATGQGKSVGINALLVSLLYRKHPSQLKFVLVDPKKVELSIYKAIENHFLARLPGEEDAIITDTRKVVNTLNALCIEMDNRYDLLKEAGCRNIREYNEKFVARKLNPEKGHQYLPFIVLVIDEFADLIMTAGKEIEMPIARLAQLARAIGIHLIIATQRPSVNIITGTIKANFPARVAFKVASKIDSRTILDTGGAEQLIGKGDMLVSYAGDITRVQCVFVDTPEVERVVEEIGAQKGYPMPFLLPEFIDEKELEGKDFDIQNRDSYFEDAARLIVQNQMGSTSLLQRRLKLGYNRAGRLMDQLEGAGIVGPNQGSKVREVLFKTEAELEDYLRSLP